MRQYYYIDLDLRSMKIVGWGTSPVASLTGETGDMGVYRVFLTKGQFNKLIAKLT